MLIRRNLFVSSCNRSGTGVGSITGSKVEQCERMRARVNGLCAQVSALFITDLLEAY